MSEYTTLELGFLELLLAYDGPFDASSARIGGAVKAAARECVRKGLVSGKPKSYSITPAGRAVIRPDPAPAKLMEDNR